MNHVFRVVWNKSTLCWQAVSEIARSTGSHTQKDLSEPKEKTNNISFDLTLKPLVLAILSIASASVFALPQGGVVSAGSAVIQQLGVTTTINQSSQKAAIDWTSFSVGKSEAVRFNQPNTQAIALNRVTGTESSQILGSLTANGQVFVLNPNGILFGKGAQVNVGGIVATTHGISNADFMADNFKFKAGARDHQNASVENQGSIKVDDGGVLALIAPVVKNTGTLQANQGTALLAAADEVTLTLQDGSLVSYTLDKGSVQALVDNGGIIQADAGQVILTAKAQDELSHAVINHSGLIQAQTIDAKNGEIELLADMQVGQIKVTGKIDASAPTQGDGGFVETSAAKVKIADSAVVKTLAAQGKSGTWLIDPNDYTVREGGDISGETLSNNLDNGNVTLSAIGGSVGLGNIFVYDNIHSESTNQLSMQAEGEINILKGLYANQITLQAGKDIHIVDNYPNDAKDVPYNHSISFNDQLTLHAGGSVWINAPIGGRSATAKLNISVCQDTNCHTGEGDWHLGNGAQIFLPSGPNFSVTYGGSSPHTDGYYVITTPEQLQGINQLLPSMGISPNFVLGSDIVVPQNFNFQPLDFIQPKWPTGTTLNFDGFNHVISNLTINGGFFPNRTETTAGLFGTIQSMGGGIRNLVLQNTSVSGDSDGTGSLLGKGVDLRNFVIQNVKSEGVNIQGGIDGTGGLVGHISSSSAYLNGIDSSSVTGTVLSDGGVAGGLVGGIQTGGNDTRPYDPTNPDSNNIAFYIKNSRFQGSVDTRSSTNNAFSSAGGLVGGINILDSGSNSVLLKDVYARGSVKSSDTAGGMIGTVYGFAPINNGYAANVVSAPRLAGGLIGDSNLQGERSLVGTDFYNKPLSGTAGAVGDVTVDSTSFDGTTARMQRSANYTNWDFTNTWRIVEGYSYPQLRALTEGTLIAQAQDVSRVYDKTAWSGGQLVYSGFVRQGDEGALYALDKFVNWNGTAEGSVNAGSYSIVANPNTYTLIAAAVDEQLYDVHILPSVLTTAPRDIVVKVEKTYDGTSIIDSGFTASNVVAGDTVNFSGSINTYNRNASLYSTADYETNFFPLSGLTVDNNYKITQIDATINPRVVDISVSKPYDATPTFNSGFVAGNLVAGEAINITGTATTRSSNAGTYTSFTSNTLDTHNSNYMFSSGSLVEATITKATDPVVIPTDPVITPTVPVVVPTKPVVTPTDPVVVPIAPVVTPTVPVVVPTVPVVTPTVPVIVPTVPVGAPIPDIGQCIQTTSGGATVLVTGNGGVIYHADGVTEHMDGGNFRIFANDLIKMNDNATATITFNDSSTFTMDGSNGYTTFSFDSVEKPSDRTIADLYLDSQAIWGRILPGTDDSSGYSIGDYQDIVIGVRG